MGMGCPSVSHVARPPTGTVNRHSKTIVRRHLIAYHASLDACPIVYFREFILLSYRHGYHAGNHADILKHAVLCLLLKKLTVKDTPIIFMDTHAGAGSYDLNQQWAQRTTEFLQGVERLLNHPEPPLLLKDLLTLVHQARCERAMAYPGSPAIAQALLRPQDKLVLMELHNNEIRALKRNCRKDKRISFHHRDGFEGLVGLMPPAIARGLVLVDPSYEMKADYEQAASRVIKAAERWSTGTFAVWYPLLGKDRNRSQPMLQRLKSGTSSMLVAELRVKVPSEDFGMHGSGMAIINPPWQLDDQLQELLPPLSEILAQDDQAGWHVEWLKAKN